MNINIFYRKKESEQHSIEKVYDTLTPYFKDYNVSIIEVPFKSKGFIKRVLNIIYSAFKQASINHISGDVHYINLFMKKRKTILTIHDVYPLYRTTGLRRFLLKLFWFKLPIKKSLKVVTVSVFSKSEIIKHFKVSPDKIHVIYNCISPKFKSSNKLFNAKQSSILHLGTKENKNLTNLLEAINGLNVKLTIVGNLNMNQKEKLNDYKIIYKNFENLPDAQLIELYKESDIVSFISTYEGFGLPIIEAQAIGRPVITSNVASMPEVAGKGAILVNPYSVEEIKNGILDIINNTELREDLIKEGLENVKRFEPKKIAKQYTNLYQEILDAQ